MTGIHLLSNQEKTGQGAQTGFQTEHQIFNKNPNKLGCCHTKSGPWAAPVSWETASGDRSTESSMSSPLRAPPPRRKNKKSETESHLGHRSVFRLLAHSYATGRFQGQHDKTRTNIQPTIHYRQHKTHHHRHRADTEARRVVSSGPSRRGSDPARR